MAYQVEAWPSLITVIRSRPEHDNSFVFPACVTQVQKLTNTDWKTLDSSPTAMNGGIRDKLLALILTCMQSALNPIKQEGEGKQL